MAQRVLSTGKWSRVRGFLTGLGVVAALALSAGGAAAQTLGVATMQPGTLNNTTAAAIAKVIQQKMRMQARLQPQAGESVLLPLVNNGEADFGIANILEVVEAHEGTARAGKQSNLRVVAAIHPLRVAFFARKDSGIKAVPDLRGKRVPLGFSAMRTIDSLAQAGLAAGGLTVDDVQPVLVPNVIRSADDFMSGAADVFFFAMGAGKVSEADASVGGVRVVSTPNTPEALAAAQKIFRYLYISELAPRPGLTGVLESVNILTYDNLLVTSTNVKDDVIYRLLDTLATNKADLVATAPWLGEVSVEQYHKQYPVPYHTAAVRYFTEKNIAAK
jgi:TRAP transporter TAXI family solute receptor